MKLLATLIFTFLFSQSCFLQTTIKGKVTGNKQPLIGASVMIKGTYDAGLTNTNGEYVIKTNESDSVYLVVRYVGYEQKTIPFLITSKEITLNINLEEKYNELDMVTISVSSFEASDKKKAVTINALDMITTPGASGNVINALQFLPGTTTVGESGKLFVRGGSSNESQTFIDGTIVHSPYNLSAPNTAVRSRYNPFMFSGNVFSTGGFSAEYGNAMSSVLLLETKGLAVEDQLDISILSISLGLAGTKKWKNNSLTSSFNYLNLKPYMSLVPQTIKWIKMPESYEGGTSYRKKTKNGMLKVYGNYNYSNFKLYNYDIDTKKDLATDLLNKNLYINSSYKGRLTDKWTFAVMGGYNLNHNDLTQGTTSLKKTTNGSHFKVRVKGKFNKKFRGLFGTEIISTQFKSGIITNYYNNTFDFTNHIIGGFSEGQYYFTKKFVARFGARFDYSTYLNKSKVSPRLSLAYKTGKYSGMSLAYGLFYQTPNKNDLIYTDQVDFEQDQQLMLNYTYNMNKRTLRAEVYYKDYNHLLKYDDNYPFYLPNYYSNKGKGYAYGLDLFFRDKKTIRNGDYWVSYSYMNTERNYLNFPTYAVPSFASKHNISLVYKHWISKWRTLFGASFNYSSPRFYNNPNKKEFNSEKMKAYQSLNLNASFLYRENVIFYASVTNVLGYQQQYGYQFSNTPNSDGVYEKQIITSPAIRFYIIGCFITLSKSGDKNQLDKIN
jgi:hypothetical protein